MVLRGVCVIIFLVCCIVQEVCCVFYWVVIRVVDGEGLGLVRWSSWFRCFSSCCWNRVWNLQERFEGFRGFWLDVFDFQDLELQICLGLGLVNFFLSLFGGCGNMYFLFLFFLVVGNSGFQSYQMVFICVCDFLVVKVGFVR